MCPKFSLIQLRIVLISAERQYGLAWRFLIVTSAQARADQPKRFKGKTNFNLLQLLPLTWLSKYTNQLILASIFLLKYAEGITKKEREMIWHQMSKKLEFDIASNEI